MFFIRPLKNKHFFFWQQKKTPTKKKKRQHKKQAKTTEKMRREKKKKVTMKDLISMGWDGSHSCWSCNQTLQIPVLIPKVIGNFQLLGCFVFLICFVTFSFLWISVFIKQFHLYSGYWKDVWICNSRKNLTFSFLLLVFFSVPLSDRLYLVVYIWSG